MNVRTRTLPSSSPAHPAKRLPTRRTATSAILCVGLGLAASPLLSGCGDRNTVEAETREIRLTKDTGFNTRPLYSPDGKRIAFSSKHEDRSEFRICVVPQGGGAIQSLTPDTVSVVAVCWQPDGQGFYGHMDPESAEFYDARLDLSGNEVEVLGRIPFAWLLAVDPVSERLLYGKFSGDNRDLAIREGHDGPLKVIAETDTWELASCFGPGEDEITSVVRSGYNDEASELRVFSIADGSQRTLPLEPGGLDAPEWSPDRQYLAFVSDQAGSEDVWVWNSRTGATVQITDSPEEDRDPSWSADGEWIAFSRQSERSNIFLSSLEDHEVRQLTDAGGRDAAPALSDDGEHVVFVRRASVEERARGHRLELFVVDVATGAETNLGVDDVIFRGESCAFWSPDASEIAYVAGEGDDPQVFRIPREGGEPTQVTVSPGSKLFPFWSPSGERMSYTRVASGRVDVYSVPANGGLERRLSTVPADYNVFGVWSPESERVAFTSVIQGKTHEIWMVEEADPSNPRSLYASESPAYAFHWAKRDDAVLLWVEGDRPSIVAVPADGSGAFTVGYPDEGTKANFIEFTPRGEGFRDELYPAGRMAYADGEKVSDIYQVRVDDKLAATLAGGER